MWTPGDAYYIPKARDRLVERFLELARKGDVIHIHGVHQIFPMYLLKKARNLKVA
ncbi:MAG: hypothetical protein QW680_10750 [Pyrobaculum sp.]